jgi:Signal transduction histidine kinase regulating citrate/malate metabolism
MKGKRVVMRSEIIIMAIILAAVGICVLVAKVLIPRQIIREMEKYQNALVGRQFEEIQNAYREMRGWRHDYKNHMQVLKIYVENQEWEHALAYISQMNEDLTSVDHVVKTGNVMADAIVNSKVAMVKRKGIRLDVTAKVPERLPISDVEFCVIFGNLMDNAIEACEKVASKEKRFIRIYIGQFKKQFYLSVTNATNQTKRTGRYYSLKGEGHGFGLYRIDKIVKGKNGYLNRKDEPGVFATEIMLPFLLDMGRRER